MVMMSRRGGADSDGGQEVEMKGKSNEETGESVLLRFRRSQNPS